MIPLGVPGKLEASICGSSRIGSAPMLASCGSVMWDWYVDIYGDRHVELLPLVALATWLKHFHFPCGKLRDVPLCLGVHGGYVTYHSHRMCVLTPYFSGWLGGGAQTVGSEGFSYGDGW